MAEERFEFGENWQRYLDNTLDEERIAAARQSLQRDFAVESFEGKRFLDIGCGSGVFSLCAHSLGAEEIVSFDYDKDSVEATRRLYEEAGEPDNWTIRQGDILDGDFVADLPESDYVYSWGVLHHTGSLWDAIDNTLSVTAPGGICYLAIYNNVRTRKLSNGQLKSSDWLAIKQIYHKSPRLVKKAMEEGYETLWTMLTYKRGSSPEDAKESTKEYRGMSPEEGIRDWLGGLPYEYATVGAVCDHVLQDSEFVAEYTDENVRTGNNLYRFRREE